MAVQKLPRAAALPLTVYSLRADLYFQNNSPLTSVREKIGISFMEYWETLLATPSTFECTPEDMCLPDTLANTEMGLAFTWQHCCDWDEYRATNGEGSATYETIMYACTTLKFRMRFQQLLEELKFHGNEYDPKKIGTDDYPQIKYDQLLQGLVNLNCGSDALDLQEQIRRGHVGLEDEQAHDLGTLLNDLNKAKTDVEAKVEAAKLNMNTTPEQQAKLEKDLARIIAAIVRSPSRLPLRRPAAVANHPRALLLQAEHEFSEADYDRIRAGDDLLRQQGDEGSAPQPQPEPEPGAKPEHRPFSLGGEDDDDEMET